MKISVDDIELFTVSSTQKNVICNDINVDDFDADMKRRLDYIIMRKYDECFRRLKDEWDPKLQGRVASIPTDQDEYALLVFSQPDYLDKKQRDLE